MKTSFWEVRLLYFSFFKKSFLKVTKTLLSFLSFFFGQSDWFLWNLFSRNFFIFPKFFGDAVASLKTLGFQLNQLWWVEKGMDTRSWKACEAYFMEKSLIPAQCHQHRLLAQVCSVGEILDYIPAKRRSHLRVKNQKKYSFFFLFFSLNFWQ